MRTRLPPYRGFTLIELMVVTAIVGLLLSILVPSLGRGRETARRVKCQCNVRQLTMAMQHHADEHRGIYMALSNVWADNFEHIFPTYLTDLDVAVCPSTRNRVDDPIATPGRPSDLAAAAKNRFDQTGGHSYETFGWMIGPVIYPDGRVVDGSGSRRSVQLYAGVLEPNQPAAMLKTHQTVKKPSQEFIVLDSDQGGYGDPADLHNNYPDPPNNHGVAGGNIAFLDGHVDWVPQHRYRRVYHNGYHLTYGVERYHKHTGQPLCPELKITTVTRGGKSFTKLSYQ
jgi:prepilin-type N-terminal cleavage/methylation domain-containing protein/prepilin-type processing-associated H-X9-DG protein